MAGQSPANPATPLCRRVQRPPHLLTGQRLLLLEDEEWLTFRGDGAAVAVLDLRIPPPTRKAQGRAQSRPLLFRSNSSASTSRSRIQNWEPVEDRFLPSSRLANEAAGTATRFIQGSASPPLPIGQ